MEIGVVVIINQTQVMQINMRRPHARARGLLEDVCAWHVVRAGSVCEAVVWKPMTFIVEVMSVSCGSVPHAEPHAELRLLPGLHMDASC
jgi:hypothetical protein